MRKLQAVTSHQDGIKSRRQIKILIVILHDSYCYCSLSYISLSAAQNFRHLTINFTASNDENKDFCEI